MSDHDLDDLARRIAEAGLSALRIPTTGLDAAHVADAILPLLAPLFEKRDRLLRAVGLFMRDEDLNVHLALGEWAYVAEVVGLTEAEIQSALDAAEEDA